MSDEPEKPAAPEDERTVFQPRVPVDAAPPPAAPPSRPPETSFRPMAPRTGTINRIQVGDVLNHIFEVKRFIARGGMGEVFEGINVTSDERVAIKVMLPALAEDPNVVAMFRKEARTLTRLSHPALVQYRVLAQEPQLGVLYIVTEFVDGRNLSDVLGQVPRDGASLVALTRRLADGLRVAHDLGAVHRDISPDNVLLADGRLDQAKIIDFGIAKDLDASTGTIVGDGFAGKLNYVAPEQLGDFGRDVGPWSDVYSLALVVLAVALGKNVDMGATLVDAVDKRRAGPDLSVVPPSVRPVLEAMLKPNPAERLRSMAEVVAALDVVPFSVAQAMSDAPRTLSTPPTAKAETPPAPPPPPPPPAPTPAPPPIEPERTIWAPPPKPAAVPEPPVAAADPSTQQDAEPRRGVPKAAIYGGAAAAGIAVIALAVTMFGGGKPADSAKGGAPKTVAGAPAPTVEGARAALAKALPGVPCSWLDVKDLRGDGAGVTVSLAGVAGSPPQAQGAVRDALAAAGFAQPNIDLEGVAPIQPAACQVLDAYRAIKAPTAAQLSIEQNKFEIAKSVDPARAGESYATTVFRVAPGPADRNLTVLGMEADGTINQLLPDRAAFDKFTEDQHSSGEIRSISVEATTPGWSGYVLVTGKGPFDAALVAPGMGARGADWAARLAKAAAERGWHAEMVWFKIVDERPD